MRKSLTWWAVPYEMLLGTSPVSPVSIYRTIYRGGITY